jgi:hypothetical protein
VAGSVYFMISRQQNSQNNDSDYKLQHQWGEHPFQKQAYTCWSPKMSGPEGTNLVPECQFQIGLKWNVRWPARILIGRLPPPNLNGIWTTSAFSSVQWDPIMMIVWGGALTLNFYLSWTIAKSNQCCLAFSTDNEL